MVAVEEVLQADYFGSKREEKLVKSALHLQGAGGGLLRPASGDNSWKSPEVILPCEFCTTCGVLSQLQWHFCKNLLAGICRSEQGRKPPADLPRGKAGLSHRQPVLQILLATRSPRLCCACTTVDFALLLNKLFLFFLFFFFFCP